MRPRGSVGFSNNTSSLIPKLIRYFTQSRISHAFILSAPVGSTDVVQEAGQMVQSVPFDKHYTLCPTEEYVLYKPTAASQEAIDAAIERCFREFAGDKYGKLQLLWFVWRAIAAKFGKDVRKDKNWLADGVICSELVFYFLLYLGGEYALLLKDFNPDTIQAEDIRSVVVSRPDLFEMVEQKWLA